jgi:hemerythrin-like domain-containing protein
MLETIDKIKMTQQADQKKERFLYLREIVITHLEAEEQSIFSHFIDEIQNLEAEELALRLVEEHQEIKKCLYKIDNISIENSLWDKHFNTLSELFKNHIQHEEKNIFQHALEYFSSEELEDLSDEFDDAKLHINPD